MASTGPHLVDAESAVPGKIAIIDIGSNSIRLVVFDGLRRAPVPIFNEKVLCGLGRGLDASGMLNPEGVESAYENLSRFVALARSVGVEEPDVVATAAVRDASDGAEFVAEVERRCGVSVNVLSGEEEARLSALGVLSGIPEANGVMGDLGGGSLELVSIDHGQLGSSGTLPLGPVRLSQGEDMKPRTLNKTIDGSLDQLPWLTENRGRDFYPVGGAWRGLARLHMAQVHYPLNVIDHYAVPYSEMKTLLSVVMNQSPGSLGRIPGVSQARLDTLPLAARLMRRVLRAVKPSQLVFSAHGLREGILYGRLSEAVRAKDPLISACRDLAIGQSRFDIIGEEAMAWTEVLFPDEDAEQIRLRDAACLLADVGWSAHPDYRAEHAFYTVFRLPAAGVDHAGRAFLAIVLATRYGGGVGDNVRAAARALLTDEEAARANTLGLALRLAITLSGGSAGVLTQSSLRLDQDTLSLQLTPAGDTFIGEVVGRRLDALANALGRRSAFERQRRRQPVARRV